MSKQLQRRIAFDGEDEDYPGDSFNDIESKTQSRSSLGIYPTAQPQQGDGSGEVNGGYIPTAMYTNHVINQTDPQLLGASAALSVTSSLPVNAICAKRSAGNCYQWSGSIDSMRRLSQVNEIDSLRTELSSHEYWQYYNGAQNDEVDSDSKFASSKPLKLAQGITLRHGLVSVDMPTTIWAGIDDAKIINWLKTEGELVQLWESLCIVQSKSGKLHQVISPARGILVSIVVEERESVNLAKSVAFLAKDVEDVIRCKKYCTQLLAERKQVEVSPQISLMCEHSDERSRHYDNSLRDSFSIIG